MPDDYVAYRHIIPEVGKHMVTTIWRVEAGGLTTEAYSERFIWLPTQAQLQAIASEYFAETGGWESRGLLLLSVFHRWIKDNGSYLVNSKLSQASMEQLWLAFVMKEKYDKVWDGNDWIKNPLY